MVCLSFKYIKDKIYLIIPMFCVFFWAFLYLVSQNFIIHQGEFHGDFYVLYNAGKTVLSNPTDLYDFQNNYVYLPVFATIIAVTYCFLPFIIADYMFYFTNIIFSFIFLYIFDRILELKNLKKKIHRFLFLIIISNGWILYHHFFLNQFKFIIGVIIILIIKREIQYRERNLEKDLKFYLINYTLFVLAISLFIYLLFFFLIYVFQDIRLNKILKIENIKKYCIILMNFLFQNFLFILYPNLIIDGIKIAYYSRQTNSACESIYYLNEINLSMNFFLLFFYLTIIILIITIILSFNKKLKIEDKFSYLSLGAVFLSTFGGRAIIILFPFIVLLYIPFLRQEENWLEFIKKNKIILIGLISIFLIYMSPPIEIIIEIFPLINTILFRFILYFRFIVLFCVMGLSLLILNLTNNQK